MGELAARAEVSKLAHELGADADLLTFLTKDDEAALAELRTTIAHALFAVHEPRLRRIAGLATLLPPPLAARIAELALGPMLCGRIAGVLDVATAVRLAGHFPAPFLAKLTRWLDPARTADIVRRLPDNLVVRVARMLLDEGAYVVLGRFVAVVDESVAIQVMKVSDGEQLLQMSFYAEDRSRLDPLLAHVPDDKLEDIIRAAAAADQFDEAVSLLVFIGAEGQQRLSEALVRLDDPATADGVVRAIVALGAWNELLPVVSSLSEEAIRLLVNVPTTLDAAVIAGLIDQVLGDGLLDEARELGLLPMIAAVFAALDEEHRAVADSIDLPPELAAHL